MYVYFFLISVFLIILNMLKYGIKYDTQMQNISF